MFLFSNIRIFFRKPVLRGGFTLIEMLVVVAIMLILTTVVMINFPRYSANQQLQLVAQDILTTIRETQIYGIAVRGETIGSRVEYKSQGIYIRPGYPLENDAGQPVTPQEGYFLTYVDNDHEVGTNDNLEGFREGITTVCKKSANGGPCLYKIIESPIRALDFCVVAAGVEYCNATTAVNKIDAIDILFQRPEPEPKIWGVRGSGNSAVRFEATSARVTLIASTSEGTDAGVGQKIVHVYNNGQAFVLGENTVAPNQRTGK